MVAREVRGGYQIRPLRKYAVYGVLPTRGIGPFIASYKEKGRVAIAGNI
jgi:hypothetical protein